MSIPMGNAVAYLDLNTQKFDSKVRTASLQLNSFTKENGRRMLSFDNNVGNAFTNVGQKMTNFITKPALIAGGALAGIALKKGWDRMVELDNAKAKLEALGVSAKKVELINKNVQSAIEGTAYTSAQATTLASNAFAAGIKPGKEMERYLKNVGDAAAIAGVDLNEMGLIFGKVANKGKISGEEIQQFAERGIPIWQLLAKSTGKSMEEVQEAVRKGEVSLNDLQKGIEIGMNGAAKTLGSKTISGALTNLWAYIGKAGSSFLGASDDATTLGGKVKDIILDITDKVVAFTPKAEALGKKFASVFGGAYKIISKIPAPIKAFTAITAVSAGPLLKLTGGIFKARNAFTAFATASKGASIANGILTQRLTPMQALIGRLTVGNTKHAASIGEKAAAQALDNTQTAIGTAEEGANATATGISTTAKTAETTATQGATVAQRLLNAAMSANPIGLLIAGLTTLAGVVGVLTAKQLRATSVEAQYNKIYGDSAKARKASIKDVGVQAQTAEYYAQKIDQLNQKEKLSNSEKALMKQYVRELNQATGETTATIDKETGKTNESVNAIRKKIEAMKQEAMAEAYRKNMTKTAQQLATNEQKLAQASKQRAAAEKEAASATGPQQQDAINKKNELIKKEQALQKAVNDGSEELDMWGNAAATGSLKAGKGFDKVSQKANQSANKTKSAGNKAGKGFSNGVGNGLKSAENKAKNSGKNTGNKFSTALGNTKGKVVQTSNRLGNASTSKLDKSKDSKKSGSNTGKGFWLGLGDWISKMKKRSKSLGLAALSGYKEATDEGSPSKKAIRSGRFTGQGFAIGLASTYDEIKRIGGRLGEAAIPTIKPSLVNKPLLSSPTSLGATPLSNGQFDYDRFSRVIGANNENLAMMIDEAVSRSMNNFTMKLDSREVGRIVRAVK